MAHGMVAVDLHYQKVSGLHVAVRSDTTNEETATADQLRHSRKQYVQQPTPKNVPRMQCARAIPVA
jgi:hypothetical protein